MTCIGRSTAPHIPYKLFIVVSAQYDHFHLYLPYTPDPEFASLLEYRFHRQQEFGVLSDIYDGEEYKKYSEFFESHYNVSFALNFDGAPRFKSSSVQVWPVMLYLNELPPHLR